MRIVKTFPVVLTLDLHKEFKEAAEKLHLSLNKFFIEAAKEKIEKEKVE